MSNLLARSHLRGAAWPVLRGSTAIALSLALVFCGGDSPAGPSNDSNGPGSGNEQPGTDDPEPGDPNGTLECEIEGFPCSMSEVPRDILERMDALGDDALEMLDSGSSTEEAAAMLEQMEDVAEVAWNDDVIRFRVLQGRSTWIYRQSIFDASDVPGPAPTSLPPTPSGPARVVVSEEDEEKDALILSPYLWLVPELNDG